MSIRIFSRTWFTLTFAMTSVSCVGYAAGKILLHYQCDMYIERDFRMLKLIIYHTDKTDGLLLLE